MIANFPPPFDDLRGVYRDFDPAFELRRQSFGQWWNFYLRQGSLGEIGIEIRADTETSQTIRSQLRQRLFYRSATCFYRAFDLFLGYLSLQRHLFGTWAEVTGYYCRFYFIQALLNLLQSNWFGSEDSIPRDGLVDRTDGNFFAYFTGREYRFLKRVPLLDAFGCKGGKLGSHAIWWKIFGALNGLPGFPPLESLDFVLGDGYFNVEKRNEVNYSHEYIQGFPELEWFDAAPDNMMAHFHFQARRADRDITNIDRFYAGLNPEEDYFDEGDFYGDEAQMLWCSVDCYLRILRALGVRQVFVTVDKLERVAREHIGNDLPNLTEGIVTGVREAWEQAC